MNASQENLTGIVSFDHHEFANRPEYWQVSRAIVRLRRALIDVKADMTQDDWLQVLHDMACAVHFVDGCPECIEGREVPYAAAVDGGSVTGGYQCQRCGHRWTCTWSARSPLTWFDGDAA